MKHPFASCGLADSREDIIPNFPHQIFLFDSTLAQEVNLNSYAYATHIPPATATTSSWFSRRRAGSWATFASGALHCFRVQG